MQASRLMKYENDCSTLMLACPYYDIFCVVCEVITWRDPLRSFQERCVFVTCVLTSSQWRNDDYNDIGNTIAKGIGLSSCISVVYEMYRQFFFFNNNGLQQINNVQFFFVGSGKTSVQLSDQSAERWIHSPGRWCIVAARSSIYTRQAAKSLRDQ